MNKKDNKFMRIAIDVARKARENGNHPFGAVLVDAQGNILITGENTVITEKDCTGHAESMFKVLVNPVTSINILTKRAIGITAKPTSVPNAMAAADGQPTSYTVRLMPRFVTKAWPTSESDPHINPMIRLIPMKAIPTVTPALKARPNFAPRISAKITMMIGSIIVAPKVSKNSFIPERIESIMFLLFSMKN